MSKTMFQMRAISTVIIALVLGGCLAVEQKLSYNRSEVAAQLQPGSNTIEGSALFNQVGGGTVTCAGRRVTLVPKSSYASERMQIMYGSLQGGASYSRIPPKSTESSYSAYAADAKHTVCNAQGFFKFAKLADGEYFVTTDIAWGKYGSEGGWLMRPVRVSGGETVEIVLAP